jgi:hypothetical protein
MRISMFVWIIIALGILISCQKNSNSNLDKKTVTSELQNQSINKNVSSEKDNLLGCWQAENDPNPTFYLRKDSIHYNEDNINRRYEIRDDSLIIFYDDYVSRGKYKIMKDTLLFKDEFQTSKFIRCTSK